ncbi:hypothetical protein O0544_17355 [Edwardsiella anguillarum]|nr:hypothetical protein [Edwardsiella anguillarum]
MTERELDQDAALSFELFAGDFGGADDVSLSNKIVKGRGVYSCFICAGEIAIGERHRYAVHKFDGEIMTYRCCNACCVAMADSVNCDYEDEDQLTLVMSLLFNAEKIARRCVNG